MFMIAGGGRAQAMAIAPLGCQRRLLIVNCGNYGTQVLSGLGLLRNCVDLEFIQMNLFFNLFCIDTKLKAKDRKVNLSIGMSPR
jgi:hypothetical protein